MRWVARVTAFSDSGMPATDRGRSVDRSDVGGLFDAGREGAGGGLPPDDGEPGEGKKQTLREFLGPGFFVVLKRLQDAKADRVVFWFDN